MRSYLKSIIERERTTVDAWLVRGLLWVFSCFYSIAMRIRNWQYNSGRKSIHRPAIPVICVGNLTTGGTGKTPCVEYLARYLSDRGWATVILSRGYGQDNGPNDEAMVLEQNLPHVPHLQGADRVGLIETAIEELESQVAILDDGFQHRRLHRDFDLVLIDATRPLKDELLLPAGRLREPLSGLRRANAVLLTRTGSVSAVSVSESHAYILRFAPTTPIFDCDHLPIALEQSDGTETDLQQLKNQPIVIFSGIGNPRSFEQMLSSLGAKILATKEYPDHHAYNRDDVALLAKWAASFPPEAWIVTTQKDLVKLRVNELGNRPLYSLRIGFHVLNNEEELLRKIGLVLPESVSADDEYAESLDTTTTDNP